MIQLVNQSDTICNEINTFGVHHSSLCVEVSKFVRCRIQIRQQEFWRTFFIISYPQINRTLPDNPHQRIRGLSNFFWKTNSQERAQSTERCNRKKEDKEQNDSDRKDRDLLVLFSDKSDLGRPKSAVAGFHSTKIDENLSVHDYTTICRVMKRRSMSFVKEMTITSLLRIHHQEFPQTTKQREQFKIFKKWNFLKLILTLSTSQVTRLSGYQTRTTNFGI